jgi:uncharacterized membrane-anchored protein
MLKGMAQSSRHVLLGVALQFAILLTMVGIAARPLITGVTGLLRVVPVDPRDAFRGDYVTLGYEGIVGIGNKLSPTTTEKPFWGRPVYVPLTREADGRHWQPGDATFERPKRGMYLRGKLQASGLVVFGIESFYLQDGTGTAYENAMHHKRLSAEIALTTDGQATVKRLVIEK